MFNMYLDDVPCSTYGLYVVRRPSIPAPIKRYKEHEVLGRDGKLYIDLETYDDIVISVELNYISDKNEWFKDFRKAKRWFLEKHHCLKFSDDKEFYRKIKKIEIGNNERNSINIGKFIVSFTLDPYEYLIDGNYYYSVDLLPYNYYCISHPCYEIKGEGRCVLTVNGNEMIVNVGQNVIIDTDLRIAYRIDGVSNNTNVSGNYEDFYLNHGTNQIGISDGFELKIKPNWRCI